MPIEASSTTEARDGRGRWKPGHSGNRKGRPAAKRYPITEALEELLRANALPILQSAIELAVKEQDPKALKLCLERLMPPVRQRPVRIPIGRLTTAGGAAAAMSRAIAEAVSGRLTLDEVGELADALLPHDQLAHTENLERRLAALEQKLEGERVRSKEGRKR